MMPQEKKQQNPAQPVCLFTFGLLNRQEEVTVGGRSIVSEKLLAGLLLDAQEPLGAQAADSPMHSGHANPAILGNLRFGGEAAFILAGAHGQVGVQFCFHGGKLQLGKLWIAFE